MKTMIGIKTFKKNNVLECLLTSIQDNGYSGEEVVIADDNPCEALPVFKKFAWATAYLAGSRHGIAYNSNRLLRYFFENSDADRLCLLDNDICFKKPGLFEEIESISEANGHDHLAGFIIDADGNNGLQRDFPRSGFTRDKRINLHPGSHGVLQWYTRELVQKIGYFVRMPYFYGGEHSEHSNRALYTEGFDPELYPVIARSGKYIQACPINYHAYDVDLSRTFQENHKVMHERLHRTKQGIDLKEFNHHLDMEREVVVSQSSISTPEEILRIIKEGRRRKKK